MKNGSVSLSRLNWFFRMLSWLSSTEKEKRFFSKEYSEAEVRLWKQREKDEFNRKKKTVGS